jgi:hypothetical protein
MRRALYLVAFLAGAAIGALGTVTYIKKNYDISEKDEGGQETPKTCVKKDEPETDEDEKETLIKKTNESILESVKDPDERAEKEKLLNKYFTVSSVYGSDDDSDIDEIHDKPYKIREDEYSQFSDYDAIELTLYSDGVLADDRDEVVENAEELLGENFRELFDEGSDELFIRNDMRCCDYNILKDLQPYDYYDEERPHMIVED